MKKISVIALILVLSITTYYVVQKSPERSIASSDRTFPDYFPDKIYLSLNEDLPIEGPIERRGDEGRYLKRVFGLLVQKADQLSKEDWYFPSDSVYKTYNAFLYASLIVPFHESRLVNLRQRDDEHCATETNGVISAGSETEAKSLFNKTISELEDRKEELDKEIKELDTTYYNVKMSRQANLDNRNLRKVKYNQSKSLGKDIRNKKRFRDRTVSTVINSGKRFKSLYDGEHDPFPSCDTLSEPTQLLIAYDYQDVGMMMFNMKANPEPFENGSIFSTKKMIDYGVRHLYHSFNRNASDYESNKDLYCIKNGGKVDHFNLVRSSWANYNGGHYIKRACRFIDSMNCLKKIKGQYDTAMKKRSNKTASSFDNKVYNDYNYAFTSEKGILKDIIDKYENNKLSGNIDLDSFACRFKENDWHFMKSYTKISVFDNSHFHKYLPKDSLEYYAFLEIVNNFKNGKNSKKYIKQVLDTNYLDYIDTPYEGERVVVTDTPAPDLSSTPVVVEADSKDQEEEDAKTLESLRAELDELKLKLSQAENNAELNALMDQKSELEAKKANVLSSGIDKIIKSFKEGKDNTLEVLEGTNSSDKKEYLDSLYAEFEEKMLDALGVSELKTASDYDKEITVVNDQLKKYDSVTSIASKITEVESKITALENKETVETVASSSDEGISVTTDTEGMLPRKDETDEKFYIKGYGVFVRSESRRVPQTICGNTKDLSKPVLVEVKVIDQKSVNGYTKVWSESFNEFGSTKCSTQGFAYVGENFVVKRQASEEDVQYGVVSSGVKIRTHYNRGAWHGDVLYPGDRVIVLEVKDWGDPWYHIITEDGKEGWAWKNIELENE